MSEEFVNYDEWLITGAGTRYRFMLAPRSALSNVSSSPFAPKSVTGDRSYADYEAAAAIGFADWSTGMGQERLVDPTQYYDAVDADARSGQIVLGPQIYTAGTGHACNISGESVSGTLAIGSATYTAYATRITTTGGLTKMQRVWLPLKADRGAGTVSVKLYDNVDGAPGSALATTTISLSNLTGYSQWVQAVFSPALTVTAEATYWIAVEQTSAVPVHWSYVTFDIHPAPDTVRWTGATWETINDTLGVWFDDYLLRPDSPPNFVVGAGADSIARVWAYAGRGLYYMNTAGVPTPVPVGYGPAGSPGEYNAATKVCAGDILDHAWYRGENDTVDLLYLALGDDVAMDRCNGDLTLGTLTWLSNDPNWADHRARALCQHDGLLVYAFERNKVDCHNGAVWGIETTVDGVTSYNTEAVEVGGKTYPIRRMVSWNGSVWVGKGDGLFKITIPAGYPVTGTLTAQKIIDFLPVASLDNFSMMVVHEGDLCFSIGNGIMRYTIGNVLQSIAPDIALNVALDKRYVFRAGVSVLSTLFVLAEAGLTGSGKLLAYTEGHWHPINDLTDVTEQLIRSICVEPGWYDTYGFPRLWFGRGLDVSHVDMPTATQRRWLWSNMDYAREGYLLTPWIDGNVRDVVKDWLSVKIVVHGTLDTATYAEVYWRPNEATSWVALTDAAGASKVTVADAITSLSFPANSYSGRCQLKILLKRSISDATLTPRVEAVILRYMERPDDVRAHTRAYRLADRLEDRNGSHVTRSLAQQLDDLRVLREQKEPLTWRTWYDMDYDGTTNGEGVTHRKVHIVDFRVSEMPNEYRETGDKGEMLALVTLQEVE